MARKKCPQCGERIDADALLCRFCKKAFSIEEVAKLRRGRSIANGILVLIGLFVLVRCVSSLDSEDGAAKLGTAVAALDQAAQPLRVRLTKFSWEAYGDSYCNAQAKITNLSSEDLPFLKITLQFYRNGELIDSDGSYADVTDLAAGGASTWDAMYRCPGKAAKVEISAVSRGRAVQVE